jgi:hypothetical protein
MAKKAERPVAFTGSVGQYPRPSYYGLKGKFWEQIERYSNEIVDIQERRRKVSSRMAELRNELEYQQREHETAPQVQAARLNKDEPDDR